MFIADRLPPQWKSPMKFPVFMLLSGVILSLCLTFPAAGAVTPLWIEPATLGGELSGVVISADQSTIIAGGDQLIVLSPDGKKRWTAFGSTYLAVSSDGNSILTGEGRVVRLIDGTGNLVWERSLDTVVTDIAIAPDATAAAATGGGQVRTWSADGEQIATNSTLAVNHITILPSAKEILVTSSRAVYLSNLMLGTGWSDTSAGQNFVRVAPDASFFVTATNSRVRMYNASRGMVWEKRLPSGSVLALATSRDGSTIVTGMDDNNLRVLDRKGELLWTANATNWVTSVAVSDDGNTIVMGSRDKKVHVFNRAGTRLGIFSARSPIDLNSVAVTRDGNLIVVVDQTAVYGFRRSSFIPEDMTPAVTTEPTPDIPWVPDTTVVPETTVRRVTTRPMTIPTSYPPATPDPEAPVSPLVPLAALGILWYCVAKRR